MKERNKYIYLSNIICAVLDLNKNNDSSKIAIALLKICYQIAVNLHKELLDTSNVSINNLINKEAASDKLTQ